MNDLTLLGPWVRRFLLEHLVAERNLARNTQCSYRDALALLIPFVADKLHQSVDRLTVINVSADLVRLFLTDLERSRKCSIATRNQRLRFGIHRIVTQYGALASQKIPSLATKRVSPHTIRHTTAVHLLRAGVDINTIRAWLGHVSLDTTHIYAEVDMEMKAKALASVDIGGLKGPLPQRALPSLMAFLKGL
jgi:site-specific recombinase XerD